MREGAYSPGEHVEAEAKLAEHREGLKEADFYRQYLDGVKNEVVRQLLRKDLNTNLGEVDLNTTTHQLRDFEFCNPIGLSEITRRKGEEVAKMLQMNLSTRADIEALADMTPAEFVNHIEDAKASLIQH